MANSKFSEHTSSIKIMSVQEKKYFYSYHYSSLKMALSLLSAWISTRSFSDVSPDVSPHLGYVHSMQPTAAKMLIFFPTPDFRSGISKFGFFPDLGSNTHDEK